MRKPLWVPSKERVEQANATDFMRFVNGKYGLKINSCAELYDWSINSMPDFWAAMWDFGQVEASRMYDEVVDDLSRFPGAKWFLGSTLNFAENLLRRRDDGLAFVFRGETGRASAEMSYAQLYDSVAGLAKSLCEMGVVPGDRVAAYMPNLIETAVAMLATVSIGAVWSSCGTELGPVAVLDRFGQIEPKVLFTVAGYPYKGKTFSVLSNVEKIVNGVPSLKKVVVVPYVVEKSGIGNVSNSVLYEDFVSGDGRAQLDFERVSFDHPVYVMFSSGTTGKPKCMVQGCGVLVNHLKELLLHADLRRGDRIFYITSPSWMMWNWLLSSLAVGATVVLFDGNPNYPDWTAMWRLVQEERLTIFGCSASYINYLRSVGAQPGKRFDLSSLREISQTGSPLSVEGFEYVYREIKGDLHFNSIAGGTDINGCFAAGTPIQPVYAGELQGPAFAMKVKAYDENGTSVVDREAELVCEAPAPSMPICFWNDPDGKKYRDAYFGVFPNVWRHGDWVVVHGDTGGITFLGRSDFTLKPSGVRIGPAEIYNVVERFREIADSMVVGQDWRGDQRVILFVKLAQGFELTEDLKNRLRVALREEASPRHVPALIVGVPDVPYTFNMKKVESSVANIVNGKPVMNRDALVNPECLDFFVKILPELQKE
jgi:acetoacetyl-CoA synthetase